MLLQVCLSLWLFLIAAGQVAADNSFTTTISFYAGFDLTSGMTEIDPTALRLIIGDGMLYPRFSACNCLEWELWQEKKLQNTFLKEVLSVKTVVSIHVSEKYQAWRDISVSLHF